MLLARRIWGSAEAPRKNPKIWFARRLGKEEVSAWHKMASPLPFRGGAAGGAPTQACCSGRGRSPPHPLRDFDCETPPPPSRRRPGSSFGAIVRYSCDCRAGPRPPPGACMFLDSDDVALDQGEPLPFRGGVGVGPRHGQHACGSAPPPAPPLKGRGELISCHHGLGLPTHGGDLPSRTIGYVLSSPQREHHSSLRLRVSHPFLAVAACPVPAIRR